MSRSGRGPTTLKSLRKVSKLSTFNFMSNFYLIETDVIDDDEENWDDDAVETPYNPMEKVLQSKGNILFNPQNKTRSHKRTFRQNQRMLKNNAYGDKEEEYVYMGYEDRKTGAAEQDAEVAVPAVKTASPPPEPRPPPSVWGRGNSTAAAANQPLRRPGDGAATRPPPGFGRGFGRGRGAPALASNYDDDDGDLSEKFSSTMRGVMKDSDSDEEYPRLGGMGRGRGRKK